MQGRSSKPASGPPQPSMRPTPEPFIKVDPFPLDYSTGTPTPWSGYATGLYDCTPRRQVYVEICTDDAEPVPGPRFVNGSGVGSIEGWGGPGVGEL